MMQTGNGGCDDDIEDVVSNHAGRDGGEASLSFHAVMRLSTLKHSGGLPRENEIW